MKTKALEKHLDFSFEFNYETVNKFLDILHQADKSFMVDVFGLNYQHLSKEALCEEYGTEA